MFFKIRDRTKKAVTKEDVDPYEKNEQAFQTGLSIAKLLTGYWNSQQNPGKAYIFNRRVHHGEIGSLLSLSNLFKKSQPVPTGILSGLGKGLTIDDYDDRNEWFTFKKKSQDSTTVVAHNEEKG